MTKEQLRELRKLSRDEKIELVQSLWDDISSDQTSNDIPEEHKALSFPIVHKGLRKYIY